MKFFIFSFKIELFDNFNAFYVELLIEFEVLLLKEFYVKLVIIFY